MKKVIGKVRLCPNTPAWSNMELNIFLSKSKRKECNVFEGCDMSIIMKAVESGMIEFKEVKEVKEVKEAAPAPKASKKKTSEIVQEAKKKAKAKKEEVKVDVEVKDVKPEEPKGE
jgi:hypothetical protein